MDSEDLENSSSDDNSSEDETDDAEGTRTRRDVDWCGVEDGPGSSQSVPKFYHQSNPKFGNRMQLYSRTNYFLAVYPDGVRGTRDPNDLHTYLELKSADQVGQVRIQSQLTLMYVAMDKRGRLYAENNMWIEGTVFIEAPQGPYKTYLSRAFAHLGWYLGLKKSGKFKNGSKTAARQKAVKFLSVRSKFQ